MAESDFLDNKSKFGYGKLNPVHKPIMREHLTSKTMDRRSATGMMREASYKMIYGVNALENTGLFKAIVLHVYEGATALPAGSSFSGLVESLGNSGVESSVVIRARIPELHAHLPDPMVDAADKDERYYLRLAEMYQEFVGTNIASQDVPQRGELVYVDFGDKVNYTDGVYIGRVVEGADGASAVNPMKKSSKKLYENDRSGNSTDLKSGARRGDQMGKKRKPDDRKREYIQDGETVIADENRYSEVINYQFEDGIEIPKRYFGRFKRNKDAVTIHWGSSTPEKVAKALIRRGVSTHAAVFKDKIYQFNDFKRGGAHAKGANRTIGMDITQHPEVEWLERHLKQGLKVEVIENPIYEEFSKRRRRKTDMPKEILSLDPRTAQTAREFILDMHENLGIPLRVPRNKDGSYRYDVLSKEELKAFLDEGGFIGHFHSSEGKWDIAPWWATIFDAIPDVG